MRHVETDSLKGEKLADWTVVRIVLRAPVHKPSKTEYQEMTLAVMRFGGANIFKHGLQPIGGQYKRGKDNLREQAVSKVKAETGIELTTEQLVYVDTYTYMGKKGEVTQSVVFAAELEALPEVVSYNPDMNQASVWLPVKDGSVMNEFEDEEGEVVGWLGTAFNSQQMLQAGINVLESRKKNQ